MAIEVLRMNIDILDYYVDYLITYSRDLLMIALDDWFIIYCDCRCLALITWTLRWLEVDSGVSKSSEVEKVTK